MLQQGKPGWEEKRTGKKGVCKIDITQTTDFCKKNLDEKICFPSCPATFSCPSGSLPTKDTVAQCKGKKCEAKDCCIPNPPCKADTVLPNAADAGSCASNKGGLPACCHVLPLLVFSPRARYLSNMEPPVKLCCTNSLLVVHSSLLDALRGPVQQIEGQLAAYAWCTQKAKSGFSCTKTTCPKEGTKVKSDLHLVPLTSSLLHSLAPSIVSSSSSSPSPPNNYKLNEYYRGGQWGMWGDI